MIRHSRASRCEIVARRVGDIAELELRDDAVGAASAGGEGSGLRGLAERMAETGARSRRGLQRAGASGWSRGY